MKKLLFLLSVAFSTLLLHAQTNQVVWLNGKVYYEQPVTAIDSITYDMSNVVERDTLKLLLPRTIREIVYRDVIQEVHDTIYVYKCSGDDSNVLMGVFSVSADKQVAFTKGNLQCSGVNTGNYVWSFAENQYDMLGTDNVSGSALADKIDLFGWSANNTTAKWGISTSENNADYAGDFVDWGTNIVSTSVPNTYRTLTSDEWKYLFNTRTNASEKKGIARINLNNDGSQYANGIILLPDWWTLPAGVTFKSGLAGSYADYQTFTLAEWQQLEAAGAVFLPAAGYRSGSNVDAVQVYGFYSSATTYDNSYFPNFAYFLRFTSNQVLAATGGTGRYYGQAVRLVKDL